LDLAFVLFYLGENGFVREFRRRWLPPRFSPLFLAPPPSTRIPATSGKSRGVSAA